MGGRLGRGAGARRLAGANLSGLPLLILLRGAIMNKQYHASEERVLQVLLILMGGLQWYSWLKLFFSKVVVQLYAPGPTAAPGFIQDRFDFDLNTEFSWLSILRWWPRDSQSWRYLWEVCGLCSGFWMLQFMSMGSSSFFSEWVWEENLRSLQLKGAFSMSICFRFSMFFLIRSACFPMSLRSTSQNGTSWSPFSCSRSAVELKAYWMPRANLSSLLLLILYCPGPGSTAFSFLSPPLNLSDWEKLPILEVHLSSSEQYLLPVLSIYLRHCFLISSLWFSSSVLTFSGLILLFPNIFYLVFLISSLILLLLAGLSWQQPGPGRCSCLPACPSSPIIDPNASSPQWNDLEVVSFGSYCPGPGYRSLRRFSSMTLTLKGILVLQMTSSMCDLSPWKANGAEQEEMLLLGWSASYWPGPGFLFFSVLNLLAWFLDQSTTCMLLVWSAWEAFSMLQLPGPFSFLTMELSTQTDWFISVLLGLERMMRTKSLLPPMELVLRWLLASWMAPILDLVLLMASSQVCLGSDLAGRCWSSQMATFMLTDFSSLAGRCSVLNLSTLELKLLVILSFFS